MDETHQEFIDLLNRAHAASAADFLACLDALIAHTVEHFEQEDRWMNGSMFPPTACHHGEHQRILTLATKVREQVANGDIAVGRTLVEELLPWFENHAATMDTALSAWIRGTGYSVKRAA